MRFSSIYLFQRLTSAISLFYIMLKHNEPKEKPSIVYRNDLAKTYLGIHFISVKSTLNQYSN